MDRNFGDTIDTSSVEQIIDKNDMNDDWEAYMKSVYTDYLDFRQKIAGESIISLEEYLQLREYTEKKACD